MESNIISASGEGVGEGTSPTPPASLVSLLEASPTAIVTTTPTGIISGWSRGAEQLFGYSSSEITGQRLQVLAPPEHAEVIAQRLERLKGGEDIAPYEAPRLTKTGKLRLRPGVISERQVCPDAPQRKGGQRQGTQPFQGRPKAHSQRVTL